LFVSFCSELDEPMALYGASPFMVAHSTSPAASVPVNGDAPPPTSGAATVGAFWLNSSETWIDVESRKDDDGVHHKESHWMSESGIIDLFFTPGPAPAAVQRQFMRLTGFPALPPRFAIAYHQCRWNYKSEDDVFDVDGNFDKYDIPYDVLWLDIEHTDAKKYFTWDKAAFPNPIAMQEKLATRGRKMVTIIDPHIKRDSGYPVHTKAEKNEYYIDKADATVFDGWCWPGSVSYLDFLRPVGGASALLTVICVLFCVAPEVVRVLLRRSFVLSALCARTQISRSINMHLYTLQEVRDYWASLFTFDNYVGSSPSLYVWNDMNEPSVFNGPEITMPKDNLHTAPPPGSWRVEHRDVHNTYGMYHHAATARGIAERDPTANDGAGERPFVLTRGFFSGSQRSAAVWTGDNMALWSHLKIARR
jgi:alpha 1,3-glucosidase